MVARWLALAALLVALATAAGSPPEEHHEDEPETANQTMIFDRKNKWVAAQPELQNQPLDTDPVLSRARPPQPVLDDTGPPASIFLGLSGFRDGLRCGKTIFTAYSHADVPERVFVGVVDQREPTDEACLDVYCKMAATQWPEHGDCRWGSAVALVVMKCVWAAGAS